MIKREDIQRLIQASHTENPVLTVYLDMSVNSDNKRTHQLFLAQQRTQFAELESDRPNHHREPIGEAFERIEQWLSSEFDQSNKGVALFIEIDGDWFEALQLPVPVENRLAIADNPVVGPLARVIEHERTHTVALVDREHFRMLSVYLRQVTAEKRLEPDVYPTPHDIQKGGYAQKEYQKYKAEETHRLFKQFAHELTEFTHRENGEDIIVLGTVENVKHFLEFLPKELAERVVHTANAGIGESDAEIVDRLNDFFEQQRVREEQEIVFEFQERVRQRHFATSGMRDTLVQLQEGKVGRLIVTRDAEGHGAQCQKCNFLLADTDGACPYCGGETKDGVDVVEAMIRIATQQEIPIEFAPPGVMADLVDVGAFLKF